VPTISFNGLAGKPQKIPTHNSTHIFIGGLPKS
jgi:hypothetical protein